MTTYSAQDSIAVEARPGAAATLAPHVRGVSAIRAYAGFYRDPIRCMDRLNSRFGNAVDVTLPFSRDDRGPQCLFLVGPKYNRDILLDCDHFRPTGVWPIPGGEGTALANLRRNLLCMRGDEHDAYANAVVPILGRKRVRQMFERVKQIAKAEIDTWPVGETADVLSLARRLTQRYAFSLLFGADAAKDIETFGRLIDNFHASSWSRLAFFCRLNLPWSPFRRVHDRAQGLQDFVLNWAAEQKQCPVDRNLRAAMANATQHDGRDIPTKTIAANLAAVGMASYETSALTLTWALFLLSQHPVILGAVLDELDAVAPIEDLDVETLSKQPILEGVICETMRLIAPVPVIGFRVVQDCEAAGYALEQNALVLISPHLTHRMPSLYSSPRAFRPQRWMEIRPTAYEYLPFSAGPRRCPGHWFAMNNLKVALATILPRLKLSVRTGARIDRGYAATTIPKNGMPMSIAPQDRKLEKTHCKGSVFDLYDPV